MTIPVEKKITIISSWDAERLYRYGLLALVLLALAIRLPGMGKGLWFDEYYSVDVNAQANLIAMLKTSGAVNQFPLYTLLLKGWSLLGDSVVMLRLFSVLTSMVTLLVVLKWLLPYSRLAALLAGSSLATMPVFLRYAHEIRPYPLLVLGTAVAFFSASYLAANPGKYGGYLGVAAGLCIVVSTHLVGAMLIAPVLLFIVLLVPAPKSLRLGRLAGAIVLPATIFVILYLLYRHYYLQQNVSSWWMPPLSSELLAATAVYFFKFPAQQEIQPESVSMVVGILGAGTAVVALIWGKWRRSFPFLMAAFLYWLQLAAYSLLVTPIFWYRIVLPGLIPLVAFAALQVATIAGKRKRFVVAAVVLGLNLFCALTWITKAAAQPVEALREPAQRLAARWQPGDRVLFYPHYLEGPVRYYFEALPAEAVTAVRPRSTSPQLQAFLNEVPETHSAGALFLVIRVDLVSQSDFQTYQELLMLLKSRAGRFPTIHSVLIMSHDVAIRPDLRETRQQMLDDLATAFGPAFTFQDSGTFLFASYEANRP